MSKRQKYRGDGGFYMVARQMTRSAAYRSLSPRAGWLLHALMDAYEGKDNRIAMSTREAAAWLKSGLHQAAVAFAELQDKGFVRCHERGSFKLKVRHASTWTLAMFGRHGQKATLDFLNWQPDGEAPKNKTRLPPWHQHGCQDGINEPPIDAAAASVKPNHGCQDGINTDAAPASLYRSTIPTHVPDLHLRGGRAERAAWLRSWLRSGRLTPEAAASAIGLDPEHIDEIAAAKSTLTKANWEKLGALVATLHERLH